MQTSPEVVSELPSVAFRSEAPKPSNEVINRRQHERFGVAGSFVRVHCKSFPVHGATAEVNPTGVFGVLQRLFSSQCEVVDLSKGGLSFETTRELTQGQRVTVSLHVPGHEAPLMLVGEVRWQKPLRHSRIRTVGVHFAPFGKREGCNSIQALHVLRQLESEYGK